jgi:hypothetical protein
MALDMGENDADNPLNYHMRFVAPLIYEGSTREWQSTKQTITPLTRSNSYAC